MSRYTNWLLEVAADVLVGVAIYGLLRLVERRRGLDWAELFSFLRNRAKPRMPAQSWF